MKFWDSEKYRQLTCSCEADALRAAGFCIVDDDAPEPAPAPELAPDPTPVPAAPAPRRGRKGDA